MERANNLTTHVKNTSPWARSTSQTVLLTLGKKTSLLISRLGTKTYATVCHTCTTPANPNCTGILTCGMSKTLIALRSFQLAASDFSEQIYLSAEVRKVAMTIHTVLNISGGKKSRRLPCRSLPQPLQVSTAHHPQLSKAAAWCRAQCWLGDHARTRAGN